MTIHRTEDQTGPALMTVHFSELDTTRTETINMKHRHSSDILSKLLDITKAKEVETSKEDIRLGEELEAQRKVSEADAERCNAINAEKKRQKEMLDQARGQIAAEKLA